MVYLFCLCSQAPPLEDHYSQNNGIHCIAVENFYAIIRQVNKEEFGEEALAVNL